MQPCKKRLTAVLVAVVCLLSCILPASAITVTQTAPPEIDAAVSVWDIENAPADLTGWLSDLYGILWGSDGTASAAGNLTASVVEGKGVDGSRALAWTQLHSAWGNSSLVEFRQDAAAVTDWTGAKNLYFYMDASEINQAIKFEFFLYAAGSISRMGGSLIRIWAGEAWTDVVMTQPSEAMLPANFKGWVQIPLEDVFPDTDLSRVERLGFMTEHSQENASVYFDAFCADIGETPPEIEDEPEGIVVWDMENIPDDLTDWALDRFVELWGSEDIGVAYGKWKPIGVDGKGVDGSRALGWINYEWTWGNNTWLFIGNDKTAKTNWTGAEILYVYVDNTEIRGSGTLPTDITLYTAANKMLEMQEGAGWAYLQNGKWVDCAINEWKHMLIPYGFAGWVKIPIAPVYGECDLTTVQRIGFHTQHEQENGTVYFDQFMLDKCDDQSSFDPTELEAAKTDVDLVPDAPVSNSADYFCTWGAQGSACGGSVTIRDVLNDEALFGENGWAYLFPEEIRKDLIIVLDDGWDLPLSDNGKDNEDYYGSFILDNEKFPNYGETYVERLTTLVNKFKAAGWQGVGVWICCQEDAAHSPTDGKYDKSYWLERLDWCRQAGIAYWKIDWGRYCYDVGWRQFISDAANRLYPELIIEHISGDTGTNDPLGTGTVDGKLPKMLELVKFSDVFRTYDQTTQLCLVTTFERVGKTLAGAQVLNGANLGLVNCEDEVYLASTLGLSAGILRSRINLDEVSRMVRWHRLAPSFDVSAYPVTLSETTLSDAWAFTDDTWDSTIQYNTVTQYAPAAIGRGIDLPTVTSEGEVPFLAAGRNALTGAISVGAFRRTSVGNKNHLVYSDVALSVGALTGPIGVFGVYKTLTLTFDSPIEGKRILAQDLLGDCAYDVTAFAAVNGNELVLPGDLLACIGTRNASLNDGSEPGLVLQIGDPADYAPIPGRSPRSEATRKVTLHSENGFTMTGETTVPFGADYTFTVSPEPTDPLAVYANDYRLTGENGVYTISCVMANQDVVVRAKDCEHNYQLDAAACVAPTCTEPGKNVYVCMLCGMSYEDRVPPLGHQFVDGVCTVCGAEENRFAKEIWDVDLNQDRFDPDTILTHYHDPLSEGNADAVIVPDKGYAGSAALAYRMEGAYTEALGDNNLCFQNLSALGFETDWTGGELFWFWVDTTEFAGDISLRIMFDWKRLAIDSRFWLWDGEGNKTEGGTMIEAWGNAGFGKIPLPKNYRGFIAFSFAEFEEMEMNDVKSVILHLDLGSPDTENLPKALYLDEFWITSETAYPALDGCTHPETEIRDAKAPTCTEPGYTGDTYCTVCGAKIAEGEEIPALGHNFVDGVCTVCGAEDPDYKPPVVENPFEDVHESDWFCPAVLWAISQEPPVTNGKTATTFAPADTCTRAEVVQFLWNAAGRPDPGEAENPFEDVKETDWFYNAVMWAVSNKITSGTTPKTFEPTKTCTRAEVVQFLRSAAGSPEPTATENPFEDVKETDWFYASVLWAVEKGITAGTTPTTFAPTKTCTRAEVVQFLMKADAAE